MASALRVASILTITALLSACGPHSREGTPYVGPNVAVAQTFVDSISHPGEPVRAYGCFIGSPVPIIHYVILIPGQRKQGLLLIYAVGSGFIPRVQRASFDPTASAWRLQEIPNTDWSFHHLPALQMVKDASDDSAIQARFNSIMASHPVFGQLTNVRVATLYAIFGITPWLIVPSCP